MQTITQSAKICSSTSFKASPMCG
uniref:Uncharacterized protein n=1 Tax=Arundo donax TaxID=35708 RepID=A0A0A9FB59_ARUDO